MVRRAILTVLAACLWVVGWLMGKVSVAVSWLVLAVKVGWRDARSG